MYASRTIKNFLSGTALTVITLLTGLIATPYLISWLGNERFGAFRVLYEWAGYLVLLDLGLNEALIPFIAKYQKNREVAVATGLRAHLLLIPFKLAASFGLIWFAPSIIRINPVFGKDLQIAMFLTTVSTTFFNPFLTFKILMEIDQYGYRVNLLLTIQGFLFTVLSVLLAYLRFGISSQSLALVVANLPFYFLLSQYARSTHLFHFKNADPNLTKELWTLRKPMAISNFCSRAGLMSDNLIISLIVNTSSVTSFYMTQRLINVIQGQLYNVGNSSWAALVDLYHKGQMDVVEDKLMELTRLVVIFGIVATGPVIAFNRFFVTRWVGRDEFGGDLLTVLLAANTIGLAITALWSWLFGSTGKSERIVKPYIVFAIINVSGSLFFTHLRGLAGPALGTFTALTTVTMWTLPLKLKQEFGIRRRATFNAIIQPSLILIPLVIACWLGAKQLAPIGWILISSGMIGTFLILSGFAWLFVLTAEEKAHWKRRISNFVK